MRFCYLLVSFFLLSSINFFGALRTATTNGNYNNTATWGGNPIPVAGDDITINAGVTVTMVANVSGINIARVNGTLDLAGNNLTSNDFAGSGVVNNTAAGTTSTFTFGDGSTRGFSGRIRNTGAGAILNLVKNGTGAQTLSGTLSNDFSGSTTVNGGDLILNKTDNVQAIGGDVFLGDGVGEDDLWLESYNQIADDAIITLNSAGSTNRGRFNLNGFNETIGGLNGTGGDGLIVAANGGATLGPEASPTLTINVVAGTTELFDGNLRDQNLGLGAPQLSIIKTGSGTQEFQRIGGADTDFNLSGTFSVNAGKVLFRDLDGLSISALNINSSVPEAVTFEQNTIDMEADFLITGIGEVLKSGSGTITMSVANTFTGDVSFPDGIDVDGGIISVSNSGGLGVGPKMINMSGEQNAVQRIQLSNNITIADIDIETEGRNNGNSVFLENLSGNNNWTGDISITKAGGSYHIESKSGLLSISGNINNTIPNARQYIFKGNGDISVSGVIQELGTSGDVSIRKLGSGILTLSGNNTYNGATDVSNGRLELGASNTIPNTSAVTLAGGTFLDLNGNSDVIGSLFGNGSVVNTNGTGTYTLGIGANNTNTTYNGSITNATGNISITKLGTGTLTFGGVKSYSGTTRIEQGTLRIGSATGIPADINLEMAGTGILDLNSFDLTVSNIPVSTTSSTITDNSGTAGTSTLSITFLTTTINSLILDGGTRNIQVKVANNNAGVPLFAGTSANTFSGGLVLMDGSALGGGNGTRMRVNDAVTNVGTAGAIISSPYGTGTIFIGENPTDKAGILLDVTPNNTLLNNIVFNTDLGTDVPGIRIDNAGHTLAGDITSNTGDILFHARGGTLSSVTLTGQLTGTNNFAAFSNGNGFLVTFNNTAEDNNYAGTTEIGTNTTLRLGRPNQIPDGSAVTDNGTLDLTGFSETIGSLAGSGLVDNTSGAGTYTLTTGGDNSDTEFSGVMQNTSGELALFKKGSGTFTLSGNSTFTGDIDFTLGSGAPGGILNLKSNGALGVGPKNINMFGFENTVNRILLEGGITISDVNIKTRGRNNGNLLFLQNTSGNNTWNGDITIVEDGGGYVIRSLSGTLSILGEINKTFNLTRTVDFDGNGDVVVSGVISENGSSLGSIKVRKAGTGSLTLSGANTYTGSTEVNDGVLRIENATALGAVVGSTVVANGASIDLNGVNYSLTEDLTIQGVGDNGDGAIFNSLPGSTATFPGDVTMAGNSTIDTDNQIILTGVINGSGLDLLKNGGNKLTFTNLATLRDLEIASGSLDANVSTINIERAFTSSGGTFLAKDGEVRFIGTTLQIVPNFNFHDIEVVNPSGINLSADIGVNGLITMTTGIFNTLNFEIDLGSDGSLDESNPNTNAPTSYITGDVRATRNVIQNVANNFGNIGCTITETTQASNSTVVVRTTGTGYTVDGETGILRSFDISPTVNTGLSATLVTDYFNHEIGGHTEANLIHYRSTDGGVTFSPRSTTVDVANNSATTSSISAFSIWTLSDVINNPLPISLKSLNASLLDGIVQVNWTTYSEMNNDYFTVEKSTNGLTWEEVGRVSGMGISQEEMDYSLFDMDPYVGTSYYRLKQTDYNGDFEYFGSIPINLTQRSGTISCSLYPIPSFGRSLSLLINGSEFGKYELELVNESGILLESQSIVHSGNNHSIDLKSFNFSDSKEYNFLILKLDGERKCVQKVLFE